MSDLIRCVSRDDGRVCAGRPVLTRVRRMRQGSLVPLVGQDDAGLGAANPDRALARSRRIAAGTVPFNRAAHVDPVCVRTGCKDTGRGGAMSAIGCQAVTRPRSHHLRKVKT